MACETGKWESILPDNATEMDDGFILINQVHGNGVIEGKYRKKGSSPPGEDMTNGTCKNDQLDFDIVGFHYSGKIKGRIIKGKKKTKQKDKKEFDGEEVWVGVKTA
jgi:hypothetical protein